jgi:fatty acid desaturase
MTADRQPISALEDLAPGITSDQVSRLRASELRFEWRDLVALTKREMAAEIVISLPALLLSWAFAQYGAYPAALVCSFYFFLCGLRQSHDCFHYNWSTPRRVCDAMMVLLSLMMLGSMHAIQLNHLRHHAHCLAADDVEATSARMSGIGALCRGPLFPIQLHRAAWRLARSRQRRWIGAELALNALWIVTVFAVFQVSALRYHVLCMAIGQCLTAFFAVWTVHHDCAGRIVPARTLRNRWKSIIAVDMFFHAEHHLFPKVPTRHLPELAHRLDAAAPGLALAKVY